MEIRINELPPTITVPYIFFPNWYGVRRRYDTSEPYSALVWRRDSSDQNKICRDKSRGLTCQRLHQFCWFWFGFFSHFQAGCFSVCLLWEPASIPPHQWLQTTRMPVREKAQVGTYSRNQQHLLSLSWLLVLVALWPQINRKLFHLPSEPAFLPSFGFTEFQMWATTHVKVKLALSSFQTAD